jgi:oligopeptide/dipeptide ABC transporter ATP-binding protein
MTLLSVENLRVEFGTPAAPLVAVDDVTFSIGPGEILGLVGESGSGKSLTSRAIMRLVADPGRVSRGRIVFDGRDVLGLSDAELRRFRARDVGMIFQDPFSSLNPVLRVGRQLTETLRFNAGLDRRAARERGLELLHHVGIPDPGGCFDSYPHELSGGMRQRVMIALATAAGPRLLLADEPTTALDVTTQKQILTLLARMRRENGMSILLVSHDFGVIAQMCDRVAVMYGGHIVEAGPVLEVYDNPHHPYTRALLAAVPELDAAGRSGPPRVPLAGHPPELGSRPAGCVFAPRCTFARPECGAVAMDLETVGDDHQSACPFETRQHEPAWAVGR